MQNSCGIVISHSDRIYDESSRESLPSLGPSLKQHKTGQGSIGRLRLGLLCSCGLAKGGLRLLMAVGVAAFAGTTKKSNHDPTIQSNFSLSNSDLQLNWKHFVESSKFHDWPVKMSRFNGNWLVLLKWPNNNFLANCLQGGIQEVLKQAAGGHFCRCQTLTCSKC